MSPAFTDNDGKFHWGKIGYHARSAFAVILSLAVLIGGGLIVYNVAHDAYIAWRTTEDFIGEGTEDVEVVIEAGMGVTAIGDLLTEAGVVRSTKAFRNAVSEAAAESKLRFGRFKLKKQLPAEKALAMLLDPANEVKINVTFLEGTILQQQKEALMKATGLSAEQVDPAYDPALYGNLPAAAAGQLEGVLYPATYQVLEPPSAQQVVQGQIDQFNAIATEISFAAAATDAALTQRAGQTIGEREALIIASILEKEVPVELMPRVSGVIYNRLKEGMKLEMDSTVHYAVGKYGDVFTTDEDRATDSPYNTYLYTGLPAGPIANPSRAALEAATAPEEHNLLFFVTVNLETQETLFAETYEEHLANSAKLQEYCQSSDLC